MIDAFSCAMPSTSSNASRCAGATVVTMGLLSVPTMLRTGYHKSLTTGTVAASGTLGQIIPPSIVLVLLGDIMNVSIGGSIAVSPSSEA